MRFKRDEFKRLGIDEDDLVILYDDYHHMQAGRIWWAMRYWGFENVKILNGGWKSWKLQGLPQSMDTKVATNEGAFQPKRQTHWRTGMDSFIKSRDTSCVLDARGTANYAGSPDDPKTGHIPGTINIPYSDLLDSETGCF